MKAVKNVAWLILVLLTSASWGNEVGFVEESRVQVSLQVVDGDERHVPHQSPRLRRRYPHEIQRPHLLLEQRLRIARESRRILGVTRGGQKRSRNT